MAGGVVDRETNVLALSLDTMHNLAADSHPVCAHVRVPKNSGTLRPRPLRWGVSL